MRDALLAASPEEIFLALDRLFPSEPWMQWEPETLLHELEGDVSEAAKDKLLAVQAVAANSMLSLRECVAFENVVNAFNNNICVVDAPQPPFVEEMFYAVKQLAAIVHRVHGPDKKLAFTGTVPGYIAATAKYRGWTLLPKELSAGQQQLDFLTGSHPKKENAALLARVRELYSAMRHEDARAILGSNEVQELLSQDDANATFVRQVLGLFLFDPCLPYRVERETASA